MKRPVQSASESIDEKIKELGDWRGKTLLQRAGSHGQRFSDLGLSIAARTHGQSQKRLTVATASSFFAGPGHISSHRGKLRTCVIRQAVGIETPKPNWPPQAAQESRGAGDIKYDVDASREAGLDGSDPSWYYIYGDVMGEVMESAITVKGQATIPKAVREHLGLKPGDRVKFFLHPDGTVVLLPKLSVTTLKGILRRPRRPVSIDRMREATAEGAAGPSALARHR